MAAPENNQFWKRRSKNGRDTLFASPELLWDAACEYFAWCDENPWMKKESLKSGDLAGSTMDVPTQRPYSLSGLCLYCNASEEWWRKFKNAEHKDFFGVISEVESVIDTQQFEGATVGTFNANIISRKLGLTDKQDITTGGEKFIGSPLNELSLDKLLEIRNITRNDHEE